MDGRCLSSTQSYSTVCRIRHKCGATSRVALTIKIRVPLISSGLPKSVSMYFAPIPVAKDDVLLSWVSRNHIKVFWGGETKSAWISKTSMGFFSNMTSFLSALKCADKNTFENKFYISQPGDLLATHTFKFTKSSFFIYRLPIPANAATRQRHAVT